MSEFQALALDLYYPLDENARRNYAFRIEASQFDDLVHLHDRAARRSGHDRAKIPSSFVIDQVSPTIRGSSLDQCHIGVNRILQHVVASADIARFLAFGENRSESRGSKKSTDPRSGRANAFGKIALRN